MDDSIREMRRLARRGAVALIAAASVVVGLLLIWYFVRPDFIARVTTAQMLVVLGLFLMPVVTLAAWEIDRRSRARQPAPPSQKASDPGAGRSPSRGGPEQPAVRRSRDEAIAHGGATTRPARSDAAGRRLPLRQRPESVAESRQQSAN